MLLGAIVPGYNCFVEGNGFFTAGAISGTAAMIIGTAGAGTGLAVAGIAIRASTRVATAASQKVVASTVARNVSASAVRSTKELPTVAFSRGKAPEIGKVFDDAVSAGAPTTLNRATVAQKAANRRNALRGHDSPPKGQQREEYPFASSTQGGTGALVRPVPAGEQSYQGGILSTFYRDSKVVPGDAYNVIFVP